MPIRKTPILVKQNRELWIDQLRGIAMLLVIIGHQFPEWTEYFVITSPVKIPLFFAITGYLFNDRQGSVKKFGGALWKGIVVPWLLLSLLPFKLIKALLIDHSLIVAGQYIYAFLSGDSLWFMPCCIVAEIIWFFIMKLFRNSKRKTLLVLLVSLGCAVVGFILSQFGVLFFARTNTACIAQLFICLGFLIKEFAPLIKKYQVPILIGCGILYIAMTAMTFLLYPGQNLDVHLNSYYNILICAILIFAGCVFLFVASQKFNKTAGILVFVGQNTLVFYMLSSYGLRGASFIFSRFLPNNVITSWLTVIVACLLCAVLAILLNKFLPFVVGKKKPVKN